MANLGSKNTPIEGESFGLPSGFSIDENSGNLAIRDTNGNVVAEWDETNARWDFANNTLANVDALNSNSVNTDNVSIGGFDLALDRDIRHIDTQFDSSTDSASVTIDGFDTHKPETGYKNDSGRDYYNVGYLLYVDAYVDQNHNSVNLRFNNDTDDNYEYTYIDDESVTRVTESSYIRLGHSRTSGSIHGLFYFGAEREVAVSPVYTIKPKMDGVTGREPHILQHGWYDSSAATELEVSTGGDDCNVLAGLFEVIPQEAFKQP